MKNKTYRQKAAYELSSLWDNSYTRRGGITAGNITLESNIGIHTTDEELRREWAKMGGDANIDFLLEWQTENGHNIGEIAKDKSDEWKLNISKAHIGKKLSNKTIEKLKNHPNSFGNKPAWNKGKTGYKTHPHTEETKQKMRESALGKIISKTQREKLSAHFSIPIISTNLKSGEVNEYKSQKEAKEILGLTGILHVLKGRSKQCGGYYFEYKK